MQTCILFIESSYGGLQGTRRHCLGSYRQVESNLNRKRLMKIAVIGMGKMGLPMAVQCAIKGHTVIGCDINRQTVELINSGRTPFQGEPDLDERLASSVAAGNLSCTIDTEQAVSTSEAVVILVPVYVNALGQSDFSTIDAVTRQIASTIRQGTLISYETTLPVGTTRDRFAKAIEEQSGLTAGEDFYVSFSPERVSSGTVFRDLSKYPKLVGGINHKSLEKAIDFYSSVLDFDDRPELPKPNGVWAMGSVESAEMAKLAETTYRDVNIGLANQFAVFADKLGLDIYKIIEACNSQSFSQIHQPGIAVGGHCIPVYPKMYLSGDPTASIVATARTVNESMPGYAVRKLAETFGGTLNNVRVLIMGLAYRGGVKEHAFSGAFSVKNELVKLGAEVFLHDPLYSDEEIKGLGFSPFSKEAIYDAAIVQANHSEYRHWTPKDIPGVKVILDGRDWLPKFEDEDIIQLQIGRGQSLA